MFCPNCGKALPDDAAFCDVCGTRVQNAGPVYIQPDPGAAGIQESRPAKKRSPALGVFFLLCALAATVLSSGRQYFPLNPSSNVLQTHLAAMVLSGIALIGYILIAVYLLGAYRKRGKMTLAAVGAIILCLPNVFPIISLALSSSGITYGAGMNVLMFLSNGIPLFCGLLLAVHWFIYGKAPALGIIACVIQTAVTFFSLIAAVLNLVYGNYHFGTLYAILTAAYAVFSFAVYALLLIAVIISRKDHKAGKSV